MTDSLPAGHRFGPALAGLVAAMADPDQTNVHPMRPEWRPRGMTAEEAMIRWAMLVPLGLPLAEAAREALAGFPGAGPTGEALRFVAYLEAAATRLRESAAGPGSSIVALRCSAQR
ncbi:hypothetical protein [Oceanicella sp. SM1341]|uniref:hypothetical protein n=1 Tax=Oceanicella sp. SM1341 TaxID=1548889 RepID=UPI000E46C940|nr:hypothetical protein [Oceanicella sp. SM1341]